MVDGAYDPIRLGVVGVGFWGRRHALTVQGISEAELVALVEPGVDRRAALQAEFPGVPLFSELAEALSSSDAEAWIVASSTRSHVFAAQQILEAGRPVLLEKPMAESVASAEQLKPLVRPDSSNLMLGHSHLFSSEFLYLLEATENHLPIIYIETVRHRPAALVERFPGESAYHLLMVHDLYMILRLVEREEPVRFSAQCHVHASGAHDLALAQLGWEDGRVAFIATSFLTPAGMPGDGFDRFEVYGEGWAARLEPNPRPVTVWDDRARWPAEMEVRADALAPTGMLAEEIRHFTRVVQGRAPVPVGATYQDALQVQRWLERLAKSASA